AKIKLRSELGNGVRFDQDHLKPVDQGAPGASRPDHRPFRPQCGNVSAQVRREDGAHRAAPFATGRRITIARLRGTKYFCAAACTWAGVTSRKPSRIV